MKKALVFYNPKAGIISKIKRKKNVVQALQNIGYMAYVLQVQDYFFKKVQPPKVDFDIVVAAGGDGTIRLAADYILKNNLDLPLAVIPLGSGNLVAETMGIPLKFEKAVKNISKGRIEKIDIGLLNNKDYFVLSFSMGHMAESVTRTTIKEKRRLGMWAYFKTFAFRRIRLWPYDFEVDGKHFDIHGNNLFIFNAISLLGFRPKKKLDFQDGVFDLFVITNRSFVGWLQAFIYIIFFKKPPQHVFSTSGKHFKIRVKGSGKIRAQLDGDQLELAKAEIRVLPRRLSIILGK